MKKEKIHYSDKGSHKERGLFWKAIRKLSKQCCQNCEDCPLAADVASQNDKVIYKAKEESK